MDIGKEEVEDHILEDVAVELRVDQADLEDRVINAVDADLPKDAEDLEVLKRFL